jgi:hypothetical protein
MRCGRRLPVGNYMTADFACTVHTAPRANHGRRNIGERAQPVDPSMLAALLVYSLSGTSHRLGPPQSNSCFQQSLALVLCEIEKRPRLFILGALSRPEGHPRTGGTIVDAFFSHVLSQRF